MCRTAAAAQSAKASGALNLGVVILLAPALMLFCGVYIWSLKRRDEGPGEDGRDDER
jgi:hypothetical protein